MVVLYVLLIVFALFIVFGFIGHLSEPIDSNQQSNSRGTRSVMTKKTNQTERVPTVHSLVSKVVDIESFNKLKKEYSKYERVYDSFEYSPKEERLFEVYQEAFWEAEDKTLFYQYVPELALETPTEKLKNAFKVVPLKDYKRTRKNIGGGDFEWQDVSTLSFIEKDYETSPIWFEALMEFQEIVSHRDLSESQQIEAIDKLVDLNKPFKDEFFHIEPNRSAGQEWMKYRLHQMGVPLLDRLCDAGYNTPEKLLNADLNKVRSINGFGAKKLEQLESVINQYKLTFH